MTYILNIETATKNCSVSLAADGRTVALKEISEEQFNHAEKLHIFIEDVLAEAGISLQNLDAVAVSKGPGSYTGLRIGVSSAKGLSYALNIPLIAVDTLQVLAAGLKIDDGVIVPMIDARRMEVFTQVYSTKSVPLTAAYALIVDESAFRDTEGPVHLLGDGALKCRELLNTDKFKYHEEMVYPSAREMDSLSFKKYRAAEFEDVAYFEPFYLKDFMLTTKK